MTITSDERAEAHYDDHEDEIREGIAVGDRDSRGKLLDVDPFCPHDDDAATCPPCRRAAGKSNALPVDVGNQSHSHPFEARHHGSCFGGCGLPIYPGQTIVTSGKGACHQGCL